MTLLAVSAATWALVAVLLAAGYGWVASAVRRSEARTAAAQAAQRAQVVPSVSAASAAAPLTGGAGSPLLRAPVSLPGQRCSSDAALPV